MTLGRAMKTVAVLIPAHNEARTIRQVVEESLANVTVVLVVDDGSTDGTGTIARMSGAKVLRNNNRQGLGLTLRKGLKHLKNSGFTTVITLDGDGVHDPSFIPQLIHSHKLAGADLTIGTRFPQVLKAPAIPSSKVAANTFATILINHLLNCHLSDVASGMRVFGSRALQLTFLCSDYSISFEFIMAALHCGLIVNECPIAVRYDAEELFCTSQPEFLNLLGFCISQARTRSDLRDLLVKLRSKIMRYQRVRVNAQGNRFVMIPVREYRSYAIQLQHPWYGASLEEDWILIT